MKLEVCKKYGAECDPPESSNGPGMSRDCCVRQSIKALPTLFVHTVPHFGNHVGDVRA